MRLKNEEKRHNKVQRIKCGVLVSGDAGDISVAKVDDDFAVDSTLLLEVVPGCCAFAVQCVLSGAEGTTDGYLSWMIESRTFFFYFYFFFLW